MIRRVFSCRASLSELQNHRSSSQDQGRSNASSSRVTHTQTGGIQGPPPNVARDTFLNYFFGGQGSSPYPASGPLSMFGTRQESAAAGREGYPEVRAPLTSSLGNRGLENSVAYDMKSLGKHIEAVSGLQFD